MAETIDELTVTFMEDGIEKVKELDKQILTRGGWTTIMFKYQNWDAKQEKYGAPCFAIRRYQKRNGQFQMRSKFNISSAEQARKIIECLNHWIAESEPDA